jgi:hypothetical protein
VRRLTLAAFVAILVLIPAACKRKPKPHLVEVPVFVHVASVVNMNDADAAEQLLSGFYAVEDNAWRWVARSFSVALRPPAGAAQSGARLTLKFNLQPGVLKQGPVTVRASVDGQDLPPETYTAAGTQSYVRDIPASKLGKDVVVNFACDKAMSPGNGDVRELALIVSSVGLEGK